MNVRAKVTKLRHTWAAEIAVHCDDANVRITTEKKTKKAAIEATKKWYDMMGNAQPLEWESKHLYKEAS